ncbi:MAG TPA: lysozyme [Solirubrobacteraceae bacterium]|jgi:GH24 family phage-related lysozyme (muramidase)
MHRRALATGVLALLIASVALAQDPPALSEAGVAHIKSYESFVPSLYEDQGGHCTIGYGHKLHDGGCTSADRAAHATPLTEAEGSRLLQEDATKFVRAVRGSITVPLSQDQFDMLVSLAYNIGDHAFKTSTLVDKLNAGHYDQAGAEIDKWIYVNAVLSNGQITRRATERATFGDAAPGDGCAVACPTPPEAHAPYHNLTIVNPDLSEGLVGGGQLYSPTPESRECAPYESECLIRCGSKTTQEVVCSLDFVHGVTVNLSLYGVGSGPSADDFQWHGDCGDRGGEGFLYWHDCVVLMDRDQSVSVEYLYGQCVSSTGGLFPCGGRTRRRRSSEAEEPEAEPHPSLARPSSSWRTGRRSRSLGPEWGTSSRRRIR